MLTLLLIIIFFPFIMYFILSMALELMKLLYSIMCVIDTIVAKLCSYEFPKRKKQGVSK